MSPIKAFVGSTSSLMNFLDFDLKACYGGDTVLVQLTGVESDVMLMESSDLSRFKSGQQVKYWGGHYNRSPIRLGIPRHGSWHIVVIPGLGGTVSVSAQILRAA